MSRHAYLIMAHNNWDQLRLLIGSLDHPSNDIYLHLDKKSNSPSDKEIYTYTKHSPIYIFHEYSIAWGGDTQIKCELFLLSRATKQNHVYYHLLSGVDIPLKKQSEIHRFFEGNAGHNFISFNEQANYSRNFLERIRYYRFLQNQLGRVPDDPPLVTKLLLKAEESSLTLQRKLRIDRTTRCPYVFYKGSSWFSITHEFASFLVTKESDILKYMGRSLGADEVFVQTMVMNSPFASTVIKDNLRFIDWSESDLSGSPKTLALPDYDAIVSSGKLFARKFDINKDIDIIYKLFANLD